MKNAKVFMIIVLAAIIVFSLAGCSTTTTTRVKKVNWPSHTFIPSKDYVVIGAAVVRLDDVRRGMLSTVNADLMEQAIRMGGHDIINVRVDMENKILAASAVVIRYTNDTLVVTADETPVGIVTAAQAGATAAITSRRRNR